MEVYSPLSNKHTDLKNRKLCFDGSSIVNKDFVYDFLLGNGVLDEHSLFIDCIDAEVEQFNENFPNSLIQKTTSKGNNYEWNIPAKYLSMDLRDYIINNLQGEIQSNNFSDSDINKRLRRTLLELNMWKSRNLNKLLRTLIYIVDTFKDNDIVWGTGRGSSCCCYILYLIELHDVDSILYDLDLKEFFR